MVTASSPPFFVWHTAEDAYVPPEHTYRLARVLAANQIPHTVHVYPTALTAWGSLTGVGSLRPGPLSPHHGSQNRAARTDVRVRLTPTDAWSRADRVNCTRELIPSFSNTCRKCVFTVWGDKEGSGDLSIGAALGRQARNIDLRFSQRRPPSLGPVLIA